MLGDRLRKIKDESALVQRQKDEEEKARKDQEEEMYKQEAYYIFRKITPDLELAAASGKREFWLKDELDIGKDTLSYSELNKAAPNRCDLKAEHLKGRWKYLYNLCLKEKLTPVVSWTYDGGGLRDWYIFGIKW